MDTVLLPGLQPFISAHAVSGWCNGEVNSSQPEASNWRYTFPKQWNLSLLCILFPVNLFKCKVSFLSLKFIFYSISSISRPGLVLGTYFIFMPVCCHTGDHVFIWTGFTVPCCTLELEASSCIMSGGSSLRDAQFIHRQLFFFLHTMICLLLHAQKQQPNPPPLPDPHIHLHPYAVVWRWK